MPLLFSDARAPAAVNNLTAGAIVIVLAFFKGRISERYGAWDKKIG